MESSHDSRTEGVGAVTGEGPSQSIFSLVIGVFTSPSATFAEFSRRPQILIPLILTVVIMAVTGAISVKYSSMAQYEMMKTSTVLPPAALEEMRQDALNANPVTGAIAPAAFVVVIGLLAALVAWFLGSFVFGGQAKFGAVWAVCLMGGLISVVGGLIRLPMVFAKGSIFVSLGLAAILPTKSFTSVLYSICYYLDVFAVWGIIVTGIGYAAIFGLTKGKGVAVAAITSLIFIGLLIGLTAFGLSMAGVDITLV